MQAIQDFLFPIILFMFYFYLFSRFVYGSRNDFSSDPVVGLGMVDSGFGDLPDVKEDEIEDGGEDETQGNAQDNLERLTVKELKNLASLHGLKVKSKARKGEIIQILRSST